MSQAQGSRVQIAYIPETVFGVTPATPQTQLIEYISFNGNSSPTTLVDKSIRSDRQTSYARRGNISVDGTLEVVLVPDNYDDFLQAALQGTWATNVLKVGTVQRSFAIEQGYLDLGQFRTFNGMVVDTMSLSVGTEDLVNISFGMLGSSVTNFVGTSIDTTPTPVTAKGRFFHEGGTFNEGGSAVAYISQISMELKNNVSGSRALGNTGFRNMASGRAEISGKVTGLFENTALANKFFNNSDTSLSFTLTTDAESLKFELPRMKYTKMTFSNDGEKGVTVEFEYMAYLDAASASTLTITRV